MAANWERVGEARSSLFAWSAVLAQSFQESSVSQRWSCFPGRASGHTGSGSRVQGPGPDDQPEINTVSLVTFGIMMHLL